MKQSDNNKEIRSLNKTYIVREVKEGFDKFNLGSTDIRIEMRPRVGTTQYANFSKKCEVILNHKGAKYDVGDIVWVPHTLNNKENKVDGYIYGEEYTSDNVLVCLERNIIFSGEDLTKVQSDEWVVFETFKGGEEETSSGIVLYKEANDEVGTVVCGALPKDSSVTWFTSARMEYFQKEKQYWVAHISNITTINGKTTDDFYKVDMLSDFTYEKHGLKHKGQYAAQLKSEVTPKGREKIAVLHNPNLPHTEKVAVVLKVRKCHFVRPSSVILTLGSVEKVLGESKPS